MYVKTTLTAGVPVTFSEQADFFRLLESVRGGSAGIHVKNSRTSPKHLILSQFSSRSVPRLAA